ILHKVWTEAEQLGWIIVLSGIGIGAFQLDARPADKCAFADKFQIAAGASSLHDNPIANKHPGNRWGRCRRRRLTNRVAEGNVPGDDKCQETAVFNRDVGIYRQIAVHEDYEALTACDMPIGINDDVTRAIVCSSVDRWA